MKIIDLLTHLGSSHLCRALRTISSLALSIGFLTAQSHGQGTMTLTFEGAPAGSQLDVGIYYESGMFFGSAPGNVILSGGGVSGFPDNGTGYLEVPDSNLVFGFTNTPSRYFNFLSFDAAEYGGGGAPLTLEVVGYKGMAGSTTNYFAVTSQLFQTFSPDSTFYGVYQIGILGGRFSLDNVLISGVPEPSFGTLAAAAALCVAGRARAKRRHKH